VAVLGLPIGVASAATALLFALDAGSVETYAYIAGMGAAVAGLCAGLLLPDGGAADAAVVFGWGGAAGLSLVPSGYVMAAPAMMLLAFPVLRRLCSTDPANE